MSDKIELIYPDGSKLEFASGTTGLDVAASIGKRLAQDAVAVVTPKSRDGKLDKDALYCMRHTAEHVMTEAICRLWPDTKLVYGPPVEDGFYGDIDLDSHKISVDDFP